MFILLLSIFAPQKHQVLFPFRGHRGSIHHGIHRLRAAGTVQQGQLLAPGCVQGAEGGGEEDSLAVQSKKNQKEPKRTIEHSTRAGGITDRLLQQPKLD